MGMQRERRYFGAAVSEQVGGAGDEFSGFAYRKAWRQIMAIEEHPRYDEWSAALERLQDANARYRALIYGAFKVAPELTEVARQNLADARSAYDAIPVEID